MESQGRGPVTQGLPGPRKSWDSKCDVTPREACKQQRNVIFALKVSLGISSRWKPGSSLMAQQG